MCVELDCLSSRSYFLKHQILPTDQDASDEGQRDTGMWNDWLESRFAEKDLGILKSLYHTLEVMKAS